MWTGHMVFAITDKKNKKWNSNDQSLLINGKKYANCRLDVYHEPEGNYLELNIAINKDNPVKIIILP